MYGTVKRIKSELGFGFVKDEASGIEYFFHRSGLRSGGARFEQLSEGMRVEFDEDAPGDKGPRAKNVDMA